MEVSCGQGELIEDGNVGARVYDAASGKLVEESTTLTWQWSGGTTGDGKKKEKGGPDGMAEAYCVKCKQKTEQKDPQRITTKNGRSAQQGACSVCGTKTTLMLSAEKAK